jgi:hypothetical protein
MTPLQLYGLAYVKAVSLVMGNDNWMNRNDLLKQLANAELGAHHVRRQIQDQKSLIASLIGEGSSVDEAERNLQASERAQDDHLAEIERIKDALRGR